ncbi:MAG: hypothetical protein ACK5IR_05280, partial [Tropicimonas sp.]
MQPDIRSIPADRAARVAAELDGLKGAALLAAALAHPLMGRTAMVSSFGADSVVLLHQIAQV